MKKLKILIVGCGPVGTQALHRLQMMGHSVETVERVNPKDIQPKEVDLIITEDDLNPSFHLTQLERFEDVKPEFYKPRSIPEKHPGEAPKKKEVSRLKTISCQTTFINTHTETSWRLTNRTTKKARTERGYSLRQTKGVSTASCCTISA